MIQRQKNLLLTRGVFSLSYLIYCIYITTTINQILTSPLYKKIALKIFGNNKKILVVRPASFIVRQKIENNNKISRLLILPPKGYTTDKQSLLNPHPEARKAKVYIHGKINPTKKGFKPCVDTIQFIYSLKRKIPTGKNSPYAKANKQLCGIQLKSWGNWFYVVRESGWGNFHGLLNLSSEWVLITLKKELLDQKPIQLKPIFSTLTKSQASRLSNFIKRVQEEGDKIFKRPTQINAIMKLPQLVLTRTFIQMLNAPETGEHQNCTFFAFLLKIANKNKALVRKEIMHAKKLKTAPSYYLSELNKKLS